MQSMIWETTHTAQYSIPVPTKADLEWAEGAKNKDLSYFKSDIKNLIQSNHLWRLDYINLHFPNQIDFSNPNKGDDLYFTDGKYISGALNFAKSSDKYSDLALFIEQNFNAKISSQKTLSIPATNKPIEIKSKPKSRLFHYHIPEPTKADKKWQRKVQNKPLEYFKSKIRSCIKANHIWRLNYISQRFPNQIDISEASLKVKLINLGNTLSSDLGFAISEEKYKNVALFIKAHFNANLFNANKSFNYYVLPEKNMIGMYLLLRDISCDKDKQKEFLTIVLKRNALRLIPAFIEEGIISVNDEIIRPLLMAVRDNDIDVVMALIHDYNADISLHNYSAIKLAHDLRHYDIQRYLETYAHVSLNNSITTTQNSKEIAVTKNMPLKINDNTVTVQNDNTEPSKEITLETEHKSDLFEYHIPEPTLYDLEWKKDVEKKPLKYFRKEIKSLIRGKNLWRLDYIAKRFPNGIDLSTMDMLENFISEDDSTASKLGRAISVIDNSDIILYIQKNFHAILNLPKKSFDYHVTDQKNVQAMHVILNDPGCDAQLTDHCLNVTLNDKITELLPAFVHAGLLDINDEENTPLTLAARNGDLETVATLIMNYNADIAKNDYAAIKEANRLGHYNVKSYLMSFVDVTFKNGEIVPNESPIESLPTVQWRKVNDNEIIETNISDDESMTLTRLFNFAYKHIIHTQYTNDNSLPPASILQSFDDVKEKPSLKTAFDKLIELDGDPVQDTFKHVTPFIRR